MDHIELSCNKSGTASKNHTIWVLVSTAQYIKGYTVSNASHCIDAIQKMPGSFGNLANSIRSHWLTERQQQPEPFPETHHHSRQNGHSNHLGLSFPQSVGCVWDLVGKREEWQKKTLIAHAKWQEFQCFTEGSGTVGENAGIPGIHVYTRWLPDHDSHGKSYSLHFSAAMNGPLFVLFRTYDSNTGFSWFV